MPEPTFVIVGANLAGGRAAEALRAEGFEGRVVLVGEEPHRPYERPPLSKELLRGEVPRERVFLREESWYAEQSIELRLGVRAVRLDPAGSLELATGESIRFDACLLATGGRVRRLEAEGAHLPHVRYLRTLQDAETLAAELAARPRLVVVGAGFIGAEVAASARSLGCEVTMLEIAPLPLWRVLGPELAALYAGIHRDHGVDLRLAEGVERIEPEAVVGTSGRRYAAEVVVVGVGIMPNDGLARDAGLRCEGGVVVDEHLRTSAPAVYAAGDVARYPDPWLGEPVRLEHFQAAERQGVHAARAMLGRPEPYADVPWFWSDQYDVNLQMVGHPYAGDEQVTRGSPADRSLTIVSLRAGVVVGGIALNRGGDIAVIRRMIERGAAPDRTRLADPDVPLRDLLKAAS